MSAPVIAPIAISFDEPEFEHEPGCEYENDSGEHCSRAAVWATRDRCCGYLCLACDPCVKLLDLYDPEYECLRCGTRGRWSQTFTRTRL